MRHRREIHHAAIDTARLLSFFNAGHFAPLENELNRLTREHPHSSFLWSLLGATLQMQGKEGIAALQKATLLSPNDVEAHVNLGTAQHHSGRLESAEACFRRALEVSPGLPEALVGLGNILTRRAHYDEAERSFREALRVNSDSPDAYFCLGNLQRERGDLDAALSSYRSCLHALPGFAPACNNLGSVQLELGCHDAAHRPRLWRSAQQSGSGLR